MILTIDIGNSNITIGAYRGNELLFLTRMGTDRTKMPDEYAIAIHSLLRLYGYHGSDLEGAIISSVVPPLSASLKQAITRIKPVRILTVGPGIKTGLHIAIDNPAQLGADRSGKISSAFHCNRYGNRNYHLGDGSGWQNARRFHPSRRTYFFGGADFTDSAATADRTIRSTAKYHRRQYHRLHEIRCPVRHCQYVGRYDRPLQSRTG